MAFFNTLNALCRLLTRPHAGDSSMKVLVRQRDLSDDYLRFAVQIGADGIDIHNTESLPGFAEQGYPHLEELHMLKARVEAAGLHIYRVTPAEPGRFLSGEPGGEAQLDAGLDRHQGDPP